MYGHQFYRVPTEEQVQFLNNKLENSTLEELLSDVFLDIEDVKEELGRGGYYFVPGLNQFVYYSKINNKQ